MTSLNKLAIILTIIFAFSLLIIVFQILYFLWRRRLLSRNINDNMVLETTSSKKQSVYHLKAGTSRVLPNSPTENIETTSDFDDDEEEEEEEEEIYGVSSRVLFTIKEEERWELETISDHFPSSRKDQEIVDGTVTVEIMNAVLPVHVVVEVDDTTPFSTPCSSPFYYTPSPSPPHRELNEV